MYFRKLRAGFRGKMASLLGMRKSRSFVALTAQARPALPQDDKEKGDEESRSFAAPRMTKWKAQDEKWKDVLTRN
jgi:hypothetical protein